MSAGDVATLIVCSLFLVVVVVVLVKRANRPQRLCGKCQRVMMDAWQSCQFCGWAPPAHLRFLCGPLTGQTVSLTEEVTTLGSVEDNTIVLADPGVSRKHAGIRFVTGGYECADLGSTNGVYFNGRRLPKKRLVAGDIVRVGSTEMLFLREG